MDLIRIGAFLKALRRERQLTQEQLAEALNVSRRTVSRWETGSNLPDLDLLIEMADFYQVDLRDMLNGERKSGKMDEEMKDTLLKAADYTSEEKARLLRRMHGLFIAGLLGFALYLALSSLGPDAAPYRVIGDFGLGFACGMLHVGVILTGRYEKKLRAFKTMLLQKNSQAD